MVDFDPSSFAYQEGIGQVPTFIRLFNFRVYGVDGVPPNTLGANNDFALRRDGTVAGNTVMYHKQAGAWVAFVTA